jgi:DNA-binding GntR family transcriptional regulator
LLAPAATEWDLRILTTLWRAAERYIRIGFRRLDPQPQEHHRREHAHEELLTAFRGRDPRTVAQAVSDHLERNEQIARSALADYEDRAGNGESFTADSITSA